MPNINITKFTRVIEPVASAAYSFNKQLQVMSPYHDQCLTPREAARYLDIAPRTLERWRSEGRSPTYWKAVGKYGAVTYPLSELAAWKHQKNIRALSKGSCDEFMH